MKRWILGMAVVLWCGMAFSQQPVTVAVVGLEHGHAAGLFGYLFKTPSVKLVAVVEPDKALQKEYTDRSHVDPALYVDSLDAMLKREKPKALDLYGSGTASRDYRVGGQAWH